MCMDGRYCPSNTYWMDDAGDMSACTFKTGCDKNDSKFPYTDAIADDAAAYTFDGCHNGSGAASACNPLAGEIWSTD